MNYTPTLLFLLLIFASSLQAQDQKIALSQDALNWHDLIQEDSFITPVKISAASRSLVNLSELPFTIHVISRTEILEQGYITLVDALKSLPGIRVSQPGSAREGETFTMRGLFGNTYTKILINGNQIKPYVVSGMPIGSQLPIQQAERIEVIYGPAAALYGADASSGVINIVLKDSERPVFTNASLHIGDQGYSSFNLLFGGKIGRGDNVLKFRLFGTDTRSKDRNTKYDLDNLYSVSKYTNSFLSHPNDIGNDPNYRGTIENPEINDLPQSSRSIGVTASFKTLNVSFTNMKRSDHSALGLNPSAISYANPLNSQGETIISANIRNQTNIGKVQLESNANYLKYKMEDFSNSAYINPILNGLYNFLVRNESDKEILKEQIEKNYFSRIRFNGAESNEYSFEQLMTIPTFNEGSFTGGIKYLQGDGHALRQYQPGVINFENNEITNTHYNFSDENITELSGFIQFFQPLSKSINLVAGVQYLRRKNGDFADKLKSTNPRLALLYKANEKISFRVSYNSSVRTPSPFFNANTFSVDFASQGKLQAGDDFLAAEKTSAYEAGMVWHINPKLNLNTNISYNETTSFINYNIQIVRSQMDTAPSSFILGYFNDDASIAKLVDLQLRLNFRNISNLKLGGHVSLDYTVGSENLTTSNPITLENNVVELEDLRAQPRFISHIRFFLKPAKKIRLFTDQSFASKSLTRNIFRLNRRALGNQEIYNDGFYTMDIGLNYNINKNFSLYSKITNVFNSKYGGIDANSSSDILRYNPQPRMSFRLGINYELN